MFGKRGVTKKFICLLAFFCTASIAIIPKVAIVPLTSAAITIDHTCTDISLIPENWLEQAKRLTIHYAHTSHGSQITSGVLNLESQYPINYSIAIRVSGSKGLPPTENPLALLIYDGNPPETYIDPNDYWLTEDGQK